MKIRTGFVSNSSSASYIIKVKMDKDDFKELIFNEFYNYFYLEGFIEKLDRDIAWLEGKIEKAEKEDYKISFENDILNIEYIKESVQRIIYAKELQSKLFRKKIGRDFVSEDFTKEIEELKVKTGIDSDTLDWEDLQKLIKEEGIVEKILNYGHIYLRDTNKSYFKVVGDTSMHNSYEDMPNILKEICILMMFEHPDKIECELERDGGLFED